MRRFPWQFACLWRRMEKNGASWDARMVMLNEMKRHRAALTNALASRHKSVQNASSARHDGFSGADRPVHV